MKRIEGTSDVRLIECVNPVRGKWRIRWDVQDRGDGTATYMETEFSHKPTAEEIKKTIIGWYDQQTDAAILSGYEWTVKHGYNEGQTVRVWLSAENQNNYKAKHDAARMYPQLVTFPMTYKISEDEENNAIYETFQNIDELAEFYLGGIAYIEQTVANGWRKKDAVDLSLYET